MNVENLRKIETYMRSRGYNAKRQANYVLVWKSPGVTVHEIESLLSQFPGTYNVIQLYPYMVQIEES